MSKTTGQIGSQEGNWKTDPKHFSNPGQKGVPAGKVVPGASTQPTTTNHTNRDQAMKNTASPKTGTLPKTPDMKAKKGGPPTQPWRSEYGK